MHLRWERVLAGRSASELPPDELKPLVEDGMPLKHRLGLWPRWFAEEPTFCSLSNVPGTADTSDMCSADLFDELSRQVPKETRAQIEADVPRTLPRWLGHAEQESLRRILCAYAALAPSDGYCQGVNNIAAVFILLGFDEVTALQGLRSLLKACCPGYHDRGLRGFLRDAAVLQVLVSRLLPAEAIERLDSVGVPLDVLAAGHLLSLTSGSWPLTATVRLWDLFLLEGSPAVFASFLALLQLYLPGAAESSSGLGNEGVGGESACSGSAAGHNSVEGGSPQGGSFCNAAEEDDEPAVTFRDAVQRGVTEDLQCVLDHVRELIPKIPMGLIDHLRDTLGAEGEACITSKP